MNSKPTLRNDAFIDIRAALEGTIRKHLEGNMFYYPYQTCMNCIHFEENKEICKIAKMRPPARVIAFGCPQYDYIPF